MIHFDSDFNLFFKNLAANNNKAWFDENRDRYVHKVKEPFEKFIADLISALTRIDPALKTDAKKAIFRINRDMRFSKDKTPYKLNRSAFISAHGRKAISYPGFYIHFGPEMMRLGGGVYRPDKEGLMQIRNYIAEHEQSFSKAMRNPGFVKTFQTLSGEVNKRLPTPELNAAAQTEPLLYNKQFYFTAEYPPETIERENLVDFAVSKFDKARPVYEFLKAAAES